MNELQAFLPLVIIQMLLPDVEYMNMYLIVQATFFPVKNCIM